MRHRVAPVLPFREVEAHERTPTAYRDNDITAFANGRLIRPGQWRRAAGNHIELRENQMRMFLVFRYKMTL